MNLFLRGLMTLSVIFTAPSVLAVCATITWTAPGDDGHVGQATLYDIRYSSSYIDETNWEFATKYTRAPKPQPAGSPEKVTIGDLEPQRVYYFAIKTADEEQNWSGLSRITSVITPEDFCEGYTGNIDCSPDGSRNLADLTQLVNHIYISKVPLCCPAKANTNGDLFDIIDLSDITCMIDYLFISKIETALCD